MAALEAVSDKYPSTEHLPFSPGLGEGDTVLSAGTARALFCDGKTEVVVTEKLDGGNCCVSRGMVFARTHKHEAKHPWFGTIKNMHALLAATIEDPTLELFGENMTATHSIAYAGLSSYFYLFGVRRCDVWLSYDEVVETALALGIPTPPLRYRGAIPNLDALQALIERLMQQPSAVAGGDFEGGAWWVGEGGGAGGGSAALLEQLVRPEGFVVRTAASFDARAFGRSLAKYVRAEHVQTGDDFTRLWPRNKARLLSPSYALYDSPPPPPPLLDALVPTATKSSDSQKQVVELKSKEEGGGSAGLGGVRGESSPGGAAATTPTQGSNSVEQATRRKEKGGKKH